MRIFLALVILLFSFSAANAQMMSLGYGGMMGGYGNTTPYSYYYPYNATNATPYGYYCPGFGMMGYGMMGQGFGMMGPGMMGGYGYAPGLETSSLGYGYNYTLVLDSDDNASCCTGISAWKAKQSLGGKKWKTKIFG